MENTVSTAFLRTLWLFDIKKTITHNDDYRQFEMCTVRE